MKLHLAGCSFRQTPVELRERLAFDGDKLTRALDDLNARYECEAVILNTCNRVELYLAQWNAPTPLDDDLLGEFWSEYHRLPAERVRPLLYHYRNADAVTHVFQVAASLDSLVVGEGQIAGQVKQAYESAQARGTVGPLL